jgi:hypothetical protein
MKTLVLFVLLLFVLAEKGNACSCAGARMPCEAYWNASAVFLGTVNYSTTTTSKSGDFERRGLVVRFNVDQAFRGVEGS